MMAEIAKSYIPTGYPVKGSASYSESETELDGNPIAVFQASPGVSVIATANGEVSSIAGDDAVGFIVMAIMESRQWILLGIPKWYKPKGEGGGNCHKHDSAV